MADKEATIYIVDLGRSMSKKRNGRDVTDLDWSLKWVEDKLTNIVYMARKTLVVGILGLGTDETDNSMQADTGYKHISNLQNISPMVLQDLRTLPSKLNPSNTDQRDALSAIILAVDLMMKYCGKLKWKKQIVLVTNGTGPMDSSEDDIQSTAEQIKEHGIDLLVLGVDFDDDDYGYKEEDKALTKANNETMLRKLADLCDGRVATMAEAIEGLAIPYVKPIRPTPTYKGLLCLGEPANYDTAITIDIERYFKVAIKRPPAASSYVIRGNVTDQGSIQTIHTARTYQVPDSTQPGEKKDLTREELAKGYEYGRTAVHIAESDENITKLETEPSFDILGFIPRSHVERYMVLDNSNILVAQKGNVKATLALSSLIRALYEIDSVALARLVKKTMSEPSLVLLSPLVQDEIEALVENSLPFAEDLRQYRFPPVDKVVTVTGKSLLAHRNLPNDDLMSAMSEFVDSMSLVDAEERFSVEETYSPSNFTVEHAIKYRAMHPGDEPPDIPQGLLTASKQPLDLQENSEHSLASLIKFAGVKKVPPKAKGRRRFREIEKPLSGLDVEALFKKEKRIKISSDNAIPEFKQMLDSAENDSQIKDASKQMMQILRNCVRDVYGDRYDQVIEILGEMRQALQEFEVSKLYNDFIESLKTEIMTESLGGNRKMLWYKIKVGRLGLIDQSQDEASDVTKEAAAEFYRSY